MKIFYCKTCIVKNKNRLTDAKAYTSSLLYEPNVPYKNIDDYKGVIFEDKALTAECPICKTKMLIQENYLICLWSKIKTDTGML